MRQEQLSGLTIDATEHGSTSQQLKKDLSKSVEGLVIPQTGCNSVVLVGGLGFGDFNIKSSDIDAWMIISDLNPVKRLERVSKLNKEFNLVKHRLIDTSSLSNSNFRHPPTFLTETESKQYRSAFAAKVGLPMYLGVFPTLAGQNRAGELCFTHSQLMQDLAYSCSVFQKSILHPPKSDLEDTLRYTYKRASYFLRFELLYREGLYVSNQRQLLDTCSEHLPEWKDALPSLKKLYDYSYGNSEGVSLPEFQSCVRLAMQQNMERFENDGVLENQSIEKGNLRTSVFWTLEKTRWDSLLLDRNTETLMQSMSAGGQRSWGYCFEQINALMINVNNRIPEMMLSMEWNDFSSKHMNSINELNSESMPEYYDNIYQPTLISFFDKILPYVGKYY